jgi:PAS domain-containing protein
MPIPTARRLASILRAVCAIDVTILSCSDEPILYNARVLSVLAATIALVVFLIDALTPLDIAIAVLYVVVVPLVASTASLRAAVATAWGCAVLTVIAFSMSAAEHHSGSAIARCLVSVLAIATTSVMALRNQKNTATLQGQLKLLNLTHDAIVVYDMDDLITFWNHGAEDLYGWTAREVISQHIHELTRTHSSVPLDEIRSEVLRSGHYRHMRRGCPALAESPPTRAGAGRTVDRPDDSRCQARE